MKFPRALDIALIISAVSIGNMNIVESQTIGRTDELIGQIGQRVTDGNDAKTKPRYVLFGIRKNIVITNPSHQVEKFKALLNIYKVLSGNRGQWSAGGFPTRIFVPRTDKSRPDFNGVVVKIKICWQHSISRTC